jgi:hypothetical protein
MFFILTVSYIHPVSKTKQIKCLERIIETDIKTLRSNKITRKDDIIEVLTRINNAFHDCKVEESSGRKEILDLLDRQKTLLKSYEGRGRFSTWSKNASYRLKNDFNKLISEIQRSLDNINKTDKKVYLSMILKFDLKQLELLATRPEVLNKLESIRDKLEDFNNLEEKNLKKEILTKLDEFAGEVNNDFNANLEENQKKSKRFSSWLRGKFEEIIGETVVKTEPPKKPPSGKGHKDEKEPGTQQNKTPSSKDEKKKTEINDDKDETEQSQVAGIVITILIFTCGILAVLLFYVNKKRKEDEGEAKGEPLFKDITRDLRKEINDLRNLVKELKAFDDQKSTAKDDTPGLKQKIEDLEIKVTDLMGVVNGMENNILSSMKTKLDHLDEKIKQTNLLVKEIDAKIPKSIKIKDIEDIKNPFEPGK